MVSSSINKFGGGSVRSRVLAHFADAMRGLIHTQAQRPQQPLSPMDLAKRVWGESWRVSPHLTMLNQSLAAATPGSSARLMVLMPPRHGKSLLCSEFFPAWFVGTHPDRRVILASYEADFASGWGRRARNVLEEHGQELFGATVSSSSSAANRWDISGRRGGMVTAGVGGPITGKGADLLIIDDPIKNSEDANSPTIRQKVWEWYQSTAYTRLEPSAPVVVIQTRWHSDDLGGRLLREMQQGGERWQVLELPAVAKADDALGRSIGEPLWPDRFDAEELAKIRRTVGEYFWAALYQQSPVEEEGGKIKAEWLRYWIPQGEFYRLLDGQGNRIVEVSPSDCLRFATIDAAGTSEEVARERRGKPPSRSSLSVWDFCRKGRWLILVDCRMGRWTMPEIGRNLLELQDRWRPSWSGVEDEKTGRALSEYMVAEHGLSMRLLSHEGKDKLTRAATLLNDLEQGRVFLPRALPILPEIQDELLAWSGHPDDPFDFGDTAAYAAREIDRSPPADVLSGLSVGRNSRRW